MTSVPNPEPVHADPDHLALAPSRQSGSQARGDDKPPACLGCCLVGAQVCGAMVKTWPPGAMK
jgi:hypothetical protein